MANKDISAVLEDIRNFDLNDIDWEQMGSWPVVGKIFFCILIAATVILLSFFGILNNEVKSIQVAEKKEISLKNDFKVKAFQVANLNKYKTQMEEMQVSFGSLLKQLPQETEVPGLIDDLSAAAVTSGLTLKTMDPQPLITTEFYIELPIKVEVVGDYHSLGAFVSAVSAMPRIVTLHDYEIRTTGTAGQLAMKIMAKTYQYKADKVGKK